jgi:hypothetical protein
MLLFAESSLTPVRRLKMFRHLDPISSVLHDLGCQKNRLSFVVFCYSVESPSFIWTRNLFLVGPNKFWRDIKRQSYTTLSVLATSRSWRLEDWVRNYRPTRLKCRLLCRPVSSSSIPFVDLPSMSNFFWPNNQKLVHIGSHSWHLAVSWSGSSEGMSIPFFHLNRCRR